MAKGLYQYIGKMWKKPEMRKNLKRERLIEWRRETRFKKVEKPTRLDKARALGYKAKKGFIITLNQETEQKKTKIEVIPAFKYFLNQRTNTP